MHKPYTRDRNVLKAANLGGRQLKSLMRFRSRSLCATIGSLVDNSSATLRMSFRMNVIAGRVFTLSARRSATSTKIGITVYVLTDMH